MRVKICGITQLSQGQTIRSLGATDLGFICVPQSPRYIRPSVIQAIVAGLSEASPFAAALPQSKVAGRARLKDSSHKDSTEQISPQAPAAQIQPGYIGVFVNESVVAIAAIVEQTGLTGVQLHGDESLEFCQQLRSACPQVELIKAFRIKDNESLAQAMAYQGEVDALLLDAYHPQQWGGTGQALDWQALQQFRPSCPWFLAGGLTPDNVIVALSQLQPDGIDLSSGVEHQPGDKDLIKVSRLFEQLRSHRLVDVH